MISSVSNALHMSVRPEGYPQCTAIDAIKTVVQLMFSPFGSESNYKNTLIKLIKLRAPILLKPTPQLQD